MNEKLSCRQLVIYGTNELEDLEDLGITRQELRQLVDSTLEIDEVLPSDQLEKALRSLVDEQVHLSEASPEKENYRGPEIIGELSALIDQNSALILMLVFLLRFSGPLERAIERLNKLGIKTENLEISAEFSNLREKAQKLKDK